MAPIRLVWTTLFFPTQRKFKTDSMCLRSAPLAAACVTGTYPQNRTVESRRVGLKAACHFGFHAGRHPLLLRCSLRPHGWGPHKLVSLWLLRRLQAEISMTAAAARRMAPAAVTAPTWPVTSQSNLSRDLRWATDSLKKTSWNNGSD